MCGCNLEVMCTNPQKSSLSKSSYFFMRYLNLYFRWYLAMDLLRSTPVDYRWYLQMDLLSSTPADNSIVSSQVESSSQFEGDMGDILFFVGPSVPVFLRKPATLCNTFHMEMWNVRRWHSLHWAELINVLMFPRHSKRKSWISYSV